MFLECISFYNKTTLLFIKDTEPYYKNSDAS
ncbi:MAG: hypothetical protein PETM_01644 [Petrimonas sp.]